MSDAGRVAGETAVIERIARRVCAELLRGNNAAVSQELQTQISVATRSSPPTVGGPPAAVGRVADEGDDSMAARSDHVHSLDLTGTNGVVVTGEDDSFVVGLDTEVELEMERLGLGVPAGTSRLTFPDSNLETDGIDWGGCRMWRDTPIGSSQALFYEGQYMGQAGSPDGYSFGAYAGDQPHARWVVRGDGHQRWGDGDHEFDVALIRTAAGELTVDGDLVVTGDLNAPHAATHQHGGADEIATTVPGPHVIPKAGSDGRLDPGFVPALSSHEFTVCATASARLAQSTSTVQPGDETFQLDTGETYVLLVTDPSVSGNWRLKADVTSDWSTIASKPSVSTGNGLTGGGSLATSLTLAAVADTARSGTVGAGGIGVTVDPADDIEHNGTSGLRLKATLAIARVCSALWTFANALFAMACDTRFGPPTSGSYTAGRWWLDRGLALWYYDGSAWKQRTAAVCSTWGGGSAADILTAANWNGGAILAGYRVVEPGVMEWYYNGTYSRWVSMHVLAPTLTPFDAFSWTASRYAYWDVLSLRYDYLVEEVSFDLNASVGTYDASNYWTATVRKATATFGTTADLGASNITSSGYQVLTPTLTVPDNLIATGTHRLIVIRLDKVGSAPSIQTMAATAMVRLVRK